MNTSSGPSLAMEALRAAMDRIDQVARPWRALVGQCKMMPSPFAPPDMFFVADLGETGKLTDVGFPPFRFRTSNDEPRYMVLGTIETLESLEGAIAGLGVRASDVPAAIVYYAQQKHERERRERESRA